MLQCLRSRTYAKLFAAQVSALVGTGLLTVALGLLAFKVAGGDAGVVLGTALTIRILAYVLISPIMVALVTRLARTGVLIAADAVRAAIALCLPFVDSPWQIYVLIFVLQAASATFTPTFQATIPQVLPDEEEYTAALSLSRLAYDLESLLSPALAAALLTIVSFHELFVGTALGFLASIVLVLWAKPPTITPEASSPFLERLTRGARIFGRNPELRGLAALNMSVATAVAMVLINTVVIVQGRIGAGESGVAWLLAVYGAGSMAVALLLPALLHESKDSTVMAIGSFIIPVGLIGAAVAVQMAPGSQQWGALGVIWLLLGAATSLILTPSARLLRRCATATEQPAVFAAQFSLSHACYLVSYPIAGWLGSLLDLPESALILAGIAVIAGVAARLLGQGSPSPSAAFK